MYCKNCGKEFEGNFCPNCGANVNSGVATQPVQMQTKARPKQVNSKTAFIIIVVVGLFMIFSLFRSAAKSDRAKTTYNNSSAYSADTVEQPKYELSITNSYISKDYDDKPVLVVTYNFKHHEEKSKSFSLSISDTAYQNGIECSNLVFCDDIDTEMQLNDVRPDTAYTLKVGYKLQDETTPVEIECYKYADFSDNPTPILEQTINIK